MIDTIKRFLVAFAALAFGTAAAAQAHPERTITVVVPFAAGGLTDTVTRLVGHR